VRVYCLGACEGGYSSLLKVVPGLRPDPGAAFLAVLHAEPVHVDAFAEYLDACSLLKVERAGDLSPLLGGRCYIASGEEYLTVERRDGRCFLRLNPNPFPRRGGAVNMLMTSVADMFGERSAAVILSGAGDDGLEGTREILRRGGMAVAQDPRTCLCGEMALSVIRELRVDRIARDFEMAVELNDVVEKRMGR
jgi:two-component system chemotaxis response regulator CheB